MSNKPDWKDAPEWAKYMAMDDDGEWWWFEKEPSRANGYWQETTGGQLDVANASAFAWAETLEPRP